MKVRRASLARAATGALVVIAATTAAEAVNMVPAAADNIVLSPVPVPCPKLTPPKTPLTVALQGEGSDKTGDCVPIGGGGGLGPYGIIPGVGIPLPKAVR